MGRFWTDPGQKLGQVLGRSWADLGHVLGRACSPWPDPGVFGGDHFGRKGECTEFGQVLGRCWSDDMQILAGRWADAEEILSSSWGQMLGQILARSQAEAGSRSWADLGEMLGRACGDPEEIWSVAGPPR